MLKRNKIHLHVISLISYQFVGTQFDLRRAVEVRPFVKTVVLLLYLNLDYI